jgi:hypothetical protein
MSATLRLTREVSFAIELRRGRFDISVDGVSIGSIDKDQTVELPLEPGHHTLRVRHDRYSSRDQSFDVSEGEAIDFRCHGANLWPIYVASIFFPKLAITLKRE